MQSADAQIISPSKEDVLNVDSVKQAFEDAPYFSLYKDNYFIFGPSPYKKHTAGWLLSVPVLYTEMLLECA